MAIAIDRNETKPFKLAAERDDPNGTEFIIGRIDGPVFAALAVQIAKLSPASDGVGAADAHSIRDVLRHGLRGWRRFMNSKGEEIEFKFGADGRASNESVGMIATNDSWELLGAIMEFQRLTGEERKN